jgi:hypothetical protein
MRAFLDGGGTRIGTPPLRLYVEARSSAWPSIIGGGRAYVYVEMRLRSLLIHAAAHSWILPLCNACCCARASSQT